MCIRDRSSMTHAVVAEKQGRAIGGVIGYKKAETVVCGALCGELVAVRPLLRELAGWAAEFEDVSRLVLMVAGHRELCLELQEEGLDKVLELPAMTYQGRSLPGDRERYIGILHPTLG
eukprot:TRINITY_DN4632_c0_g1_i2.p2 TRINITY_DN4632_c0_g1~~TRINITY_DN4632_c0_g1_i2.p2  ORF type:complete len:118 (-),score=25.67 TRINITY_DN4632_c0_g1_i2:228-581(-)